MWARRRTGASDPDCADHSAMNQRIPRFRDHLPHLAEQLRTRRVEHAKQYTNNSQDSVTEQGEEGEMVGRGGLMQRAATQVEPRAFNLNHLQCSAKK